MSEILADGTANGNVGVEQRPGLGSQRSKSPSSPQLKIDPVGEWANNATSTFDSTEQFHSATGTPGPNLPGAYPYTPSSLEPGPSFEEVRETAKEYLHAAGQYVPSQEDIRRMAQNAGSAVRGYIPNGVAEYLGAPQPNQEAEVISPIDERETTPTTGGGFILINRGLRATNGQTQGSHDVQHDSNTESGPTPIETSRPVGVNGLSKLNPNSYDARTPDNLASGRASDNASTRTQPGSLAISERQRDEMDVAPTPYSYTGSNIGGGGIIHQADTQVRTAPSYGLPEGHVDLMDAPLPEMRGHPDGVVNHGGVGVKLCPGGGGIVTGPGSGIAAGPGPGPGITGPTMLQAERNAGIGAGPTGEPDGTLNNDSPVEREETKGQDNVQATTTPNHDADTAHDENKARPSEEKRKVGEMDNQTVNTKPRTHPLGKEGARWKGVPLEEQYQAALDRDEDRGLAIGESKGPTAIPPKSITKDGNGSSLPTKSSMEKVHSNTATTGHEKEGSDGPRVKSRFTEPSSSKHDGSPLRLRDHDDGVGQDRPASPMTSPNNPHVGRATTGPNAAKLVEPEPGGPGPQERHGRGKGSFLQKLKTLSKRLRHDRKAHN